jgi:hypothetical protein
LPDLGCTELEIERGPHFREGSEASVVDTTTVSDPAIGVAKAQDVIRVHESEHPGDVDHETAADVPRVAHWVCPLISSQWQVGMSGHARAYDAGLFVDLDDLVDTDRAWSIRAISNKFRVQRHVYTP